MLKMAFPSLVCFTFDLPSVEPIARKHIADAGLKDQILVVSGDLLSDKFPSCDILAMGNILHEFNEEKKLLLMVKAYDSLQEGGLLMVIEDFVSDDRDQNEIALSESVQINYSSDGGFNMSIQEVKEFSKKAGFRNCEELKSKGSLLRIAALLYK